MISGWIDEVGAGKVYGRCIVGGDELAFEMDVLSVLDDQRVELEPGRYVSFVNGHLLIDKAIWTTHDIETADREAYKLHRALWPD